MKNFKKMIGIGLVFVMVAGLSFQVKAAENQDTTSVDSSMETAETEEAEVTIVPMPKDYNNLTEEQKAIIQENKENSFTEEEIANMSPEELFKYHLLPLDDSVDEFIETYGLNGTKHPAGEAADTKKERINENSTNENSADEYSSNSKTYPLRTKNLAYYGGMDSNHNVTEISIQTMEGTYEEYDRINLVADPHYDSRYCGNYGILFETLTEAVYHYTSLRGLSDLDW